MRLKFIQSGYNRFFFKPIPASSLGIFRILFSLVMLANAVLLFPDLKTWFSESGVLPNSLAKDLLSGIRINVFNLFPPTDFTLYSVFSIYLLSILCLLFGIFTRTATVLAWILTVSFHHRNTLILNSGDTVMRCLLFYMIFAPLGKTFSVERLIRVLRGKEEEGNTLFIPWSQRLMQIQVAVMYLATVAWKLRGEMWVQGTAVFYTSRLKEFERFPMPAWTRTLWYSQISSYFALAVEFSMGALVWIREWRYPILLSGLLLHLGLEYSMNVPVFQWFVLSTYVLFIEHSKWVEWKTRIIGFSSARERVYFDGDCGFCTRTVQVIEHLDLLNRFEFVSFRKKAILVDKKFPAERADSEVLMNRKGEWIGGYDVFREMAKKLPLTLLIVPFLYLPPVPQVGRLIYKWVARNRQRISDLLKMNTVCRRD